MATRTTSEEFSQQDESQREAERKRFDGIFWGGVILLAGVILIADNLGVLPQIGQAGFWSWLFLAMGVYALVLGAIRLTSANFPNPTTDEYVWTAIFLLIGLSGFIGFSLAWPVALVLIGVAILSKAVFAGRTAGA
jgi:hypothetical protein